MVGGQSEKYRMSPKTKYNFFERKKHLPQSRFDKVVKAEAEKHKQN